MSFQQQCLDEQHVLRAEREKYYRYRKKIAYIEGCVCKCGNSKAPGESFCIHCAEEKARKEAEATAKKRMSQKSDKRRRQRLSESSERCWFCGSNTLIRQFRICDNCREKWRAAHDRGEASE